MEPGREIEGGEVIQSACRREREREIMSDAGERERERGEGRRTVEELIEIVGAVVGHGGGSYFWDGRGIFLERERELLVNI